MFAKLFTFSDNTQVLVILGDPTDQVGAYRLVCITEIDGHRVNTRTIYQTMDALLQAFEAFTAEDAARFINSVLTIL